MLGMAEATNQRDGNLATELSAPGTPLTATPGQGRGTGRAKRKNGVKTASKCALRTYANTMPTNFLELRKAEVRRTPLPRTRVNRVEALIRSRSLRAMLPTKGVSSRLVR